MPYILHFVCLQVCELDINQIQTASQLPSCHPYPKYFQGLSSPPISLLFYLLNSDICCSAIISIILLLYSHNRLTVAIHSAKVHTSGGIHRYGDAAKRLPSFFDLSVNLFDHNIWVIRLDQIIFCCFACHVISPN